MSSIRYERNYLEETFIYMIRKFQLVWFMHMSINNLSGWNVLRSRFSFMQSLLSLQCSSIRYLCFSIRSTSFTTRVITVTTVKNFFPESMLNSKMLSYSVKLLPEICSVFRLLHKLYFANVNTFLNISSPYVNYNKVTKWHGESLEGHALFSVPSTLCSHFWILWGHGYMPEK
jgi:hypothetical protein